jgi:archaellum component FlaC
MMEDGTMVKKASVDGIGQAIQEIWEKFEAILNALKDARTALGHRKLSQVKNHLQYVNEQLETDDLSDDVEEALAAVDRLDAEIETLYRRAMQ